MSDLWNTVGAEAQDARHAELVEAALIGAAPYRDMLATASSDADFQNRLQIVADRLDATIGGIVGENPAEFAFTRSAVIEDARQGYQRNRLEVLAKARRKSLLQKEVLSSLKKEATGRWMVADGPSSYLGEIVMGFPQELIPDPGCFAILTNNTQVYLQGRLTGDTVSEWDVQCPVVEVRRFETVVHEDGSIWGEPGDVLDGQYFVHPDAVNDLIRPYATSSRRTADMIRTRVSIPTQLQEAGHTVETGWDDRLDTLTYIIDGQEMRLDEAADRYLGGWDNAFGKSGSRHVASSGHWECEQCESKYYDIEQCSDYDPVEAEFTLYCPACGAGDDEMVFFSSPNYIASRKTAGTFSDNVSPNDGFGPAEYYEYNGGYGVHGYIEGPYASAYYWDVQKGPHEDGNSLYGYASSVERAFALCEDADRQLRNQASRKTASRKTAMFACMECGKKYKNFPRNGQCSKCHGYDIDLDVTDIVREASRKTARGHADAYIENGKWYHATGWDKGDFGVVKSADGDYYGVVYISLDEDGDETYDIVVGMSRFDAEDSVERWAANPQTAPFDDTWTNDWDGFLDNVNASRKTAAGSSKNLSPWGELVMVTPLAPGIFSGYTASRQGGIAVTGKALRHLVKNRPVYASQGIRQGSALWFDDRTGWALVATMWPKAASPTKSMPPKRIAKFLPKKVASQYLRDVKAGGVKVNARRKGEKR